MEVIDRSPGQVNQITQTIDQLTDALGKASAASDRQARKLTAATWAIVGATLALLLVSGVHVYLSVGRTPEEQAERDLRRCQALALRLLGDKATTGSLRNATFSCLGF